MLCARGMCWMSSGTGSIAEAYYGVPADLKEAALDYLDDELRAIYDEWERFRREGRSV